MLKCLRGLSHAPLLALLLFLLASLPHAAHAAAPPSSSTTAAASTRGLETGVWPLAHVKGIASIEAWLDRSGEASFDDARLGATWRPAGPILMEGYRTGALWLRLHLAPLPENRNVADTRWLRIGAAFLDDVQVFLPGEPGRAGDAVGLSEGSSVASPVVVRGGDRREHDPSVPAGRSVLVALPSAASFDGSQPLYVRIESASSLIVRVDLLDDDRLSHRVETEALVFGLYAGLLAAIVLWSAVHAVAYRDALSALFALYLLASLALSWASAGFAAHAMGPAADGLGNALTLLVTTLALAFHQALMREVALPRPVIQAVYALVAGCLLNAVLLLVGFPRLALQSNALLVALASVMALPVLLRFLVRSADPALRGLFAAYGLLAVFILLTVLPALGAMAPHALTLVLSVALAPYTGLLFGAIILLRRLRLQQEVSAAREEVRTVSAEAAEMRAERDEKERFLSMLVHELRTPLSVIRMVLEGQMAKPDGRSRSMLHARRSVDEINEVIDRAVQVDQIERGAASPLRQRCDVTQMLDRLLEEVEPAERGRVRCVAAGDVQPVDTDPALLATILHNLLANALKYSAPGSRITTDLCNEARRGQPGVRLLVRNRPGDAGFPDPARVFSKYYRSDGARRRSGSGLGLYLVAGLAQALGGEVRYLPTNVTAADGEVGFELWLPL